MLAAGDVATAAAWNVLVGNDVATAPFFSAWTTFVPVTTGWAATFTYPYAKYCQVGKFVAFAINGQWSAAGASSGLNIAFPVTAANSAAGASLRCYILDSGTANILAQVTVASTTQFSITAINTAGTYGVSVGIDNTNPMTWAANDSFWVGGVYEAA